MLSLWPVFLALALYFGAVIYDNQATEESSQGTAAGQVLGGKFLIYRDAVLSYAAAHPGVTSAVQDAALALPGWYKKEAGFQAYLQAGQSYIWFAPTNPRPSMTDMGLYPDRAYTTSVGIAQGGHLVSPTLGVTAIPLPSVIPNGSIVYIN